MFADRGRSWAATIVAAALLASACASGGGTFRSGVGDTFPDRAPYYAGAAGKEVRSRAARLGYLPVVYQRGASQPSIFDPTAGADMDSLLAEMTGYLDLLGVGRRLAEGGKVSAVTHSLTMSPPDVSFGCITRSGAPGDECAERGDSALGRGRQRMFLAVSRPSNDWTAWMQETMTTSEVDAALVVTLEVGQYLVKQVGWRGTKEVELGAGRVEPLPWLTSLETPVTVLQLTGTVVDRNGKSMRIGAEGILLRRTPLLASSVGAQRLIGDSDVKELRTRRVNESDESPLLWQVAMRELVRQLIDGTP